MAIVPSYVQKVARAKEYLTDLKAEIAAYSSRKPYTVRERVQGKKTKTRTLVFTSDPANTDIPIILADAIYNLRSALDHLMSSLVPSAKRTSVMFPIYWQGVWEPAIEGENPERTKDRQRWSSDTKKLPNEAVTFLKRLQPADTSGKDEIPILQLVNQLSNRDRHTKLPVVAAGLRHFVLGWTMPDGTVEYGGKSPEPGKFVENNANLGEIPYRATDVEIEGTPVMVIRGSEKGRDVEIPVLLTEAIRLIENLVIRGLQPHVRA